MKILLSSLLLSWGLLTFYVWGNMRQNCCGATTEILAVETPEAKPQELPSLPLNDIILEPAPDPTRSEEIISTSKPELPAEQPSEATSKTTTLPVSTDADFVIYFGENSSMWLDDSSVSSYLRKLEERVKKSKEKIIIYAYDDDIAAPSESFAMTKRRAWRVRSAFQDNAVRRRLVIMKSEGQENPVAPNNTQDGRAKNRRVEIKIVKE